jgi:uncharacterized membrane protein YkoI
MNKLITLFTVASISLTANLVQARDLGPDQALKLRDAGIIQPFDKLNAAALAGHQGATVGETELEEEHGRYVYKVDLRDPQGVRWEVELDAATGAVLQDRQDD